MIIDTLITNRTYADVESLEAIISKPMAEWTVDELAYFLSGEQDTLSATDGDLIATDGVLVVGNGIIRGAYNYTDLNRVGAAVAYLQNRLEAECGITVSVTAKQSWQEQDIPTKSEMDIYLADVEAMRAALPLQFNTPNTPNSMERLTFYAANDIERILTAVENAINRLFPNWRYAGEYYAGEV